MLEDLTASHESVGDWPLPPSIERWHAVVHAHARFHAAWWDHRHLGVTVGAFMDDSGELDRSLAAMPTDLATFADRLGERLSPERRHRYERLIAAAPRLLDRYHSHRHLTIVHGDAHVWNAMLPRPGQAGVRPAWQANHGLPPWIWWNHLERSMRAVDDLDAAGVTQAPVASTSSSARRWLNAAGSGSVPPSARIAWPWSSSA